MASKKSIKRPTPVSLGDGWYLRVVRGPNEAGEWYWRVQKRIDGSQFTAFSSWGSAATLIEMFREKERSNALMERTEKPKPEPVIKTLSDLIEAWINFRTSTARPRTIMAYRGSQKRLLQETDRIKLNDYTEKQFDDMRNRLLAKYADNTYNLDEAIIAAAWNWGTKRRLFKFSPLPLEAIRKPRLVFEKYTPTNQEIDVIEAGLSGWMLLAFKIARHTGCRIGELERLKWSDISFKNSTMILSGKTGAREIPIPKAINEELVNWMSSHPFEKYNIFNKRPNTVRNLINRRISEIATQNGLKRVTIHSLRRAFIDRMRKAKVHPTVAAKITGHSPAVMLMVYSSVAKDEILEAMRSVESE